MDRYVASTILPYLSAQSQEEEACAARQMELVAPLPPWSLKRIVPRYGNWGGPGWSANRVMGGDVIPEVFRTQPTTDSMDEIFKAHDWAYSDASLSYRVAMDAAALEDKRSRGSVVHCSPSSYEKARAEAQHRLELAVIYADLALTRGLAQLSLVPPTRWPSPPKDPSAAQKYLDKALPLFVLKIKVAD
jgi:hypothetical protein